jgi:hypothetical protein
LRSSLSARFNDNVDNARYLRLAAQVLSVLHRRATRL